MNNFNANTIFLFQIKKYYINIRKHKQNNKKRNKTTTKKIMGSLI